MYVVRDPDDVPGIARLGPDPLDEDFTLDALAAILAHAGRAQIKGVLRDQAVIAGIGNAYSDETLHAAKMSPFKPASSMTEGGVQACTTQSARCGRRSSAPRALRIGPQGGEEVRPRRARPNG